MTDEDRAQETELVLRAKEGDAEAGREVLRIVAHKIEHRDFDSPVFQHLVESIREFIEHGIRLERALCVESEPDSGGRPAKYESFELVAVDLILRYHVGFRPEEAVNWIAEKIGADRRTIQRLREQFDANYYKPTEEEDEADSIQLMESLSLRHLLHYSGSLREKVAKVLPQTF